MISFFISEKLVFLKWIKSKIAADMIATTAGFKPIIINIKVVNKTITVIVK